MWSISARHTASSFTSTESLTRTQHVRLRVPVRTANLLPERGISNIRNILHFMRVYKFLSEEHALDDLTHHKLKVSDYQDMNDPFELKGVTGYATPGRHPLNPVLVHEAF